MRRRFIRPRLRTSAIGRLVVTVDAVRATLDALKTFSGVSGEPHEGLVYLAGRRVGDCTLAVTAVVPESKHEPFRVIASERDIGFAARVARELDLGLVAQVHSHPDGDTGHSAGDDTLILMPFEGMFSLVVADYGQGSLEPGSGVGVHQFQSGKWIEVSPVSSSVISIVPAVLDLREL